VYVPLRGKATNRMNIEGFRCRHCGSDKLISYGTAPNGKKKYLCHICGKQSRENPQSMEYSPERKEEILQMHQDGRSMRDIERSFNISRNTLRSWLKKRSGQNTVK
jgi:transposase-like protein